MARITSGERTVRDVQQVVETVVRDVVTVRTEAVYEIRDDAGVLVATAAAEERGWIIRAPDGTVLRECATRNGVERWADALAP